MPTERDISEPGLKDNSGGVALMFDPVGALVADFDFYAAYFQASVAPGWRTPSLHPQTIGIRRKLPNAVAAVRDSQFLATLRETLVRDFGLARTGLLNPLVIDTTLHRDIEQLDGCRIESVTSDDLDVLWAVVKKLKINSGKAKLVPNTKALAHVLTELVVPIDRTYTGAFLFRFASEFDNRDSERSLFYTAFRAFQKIARAVDLAKYLSAKSDPTGWNTTRPKVIDNAIIGFVQHVRVKLGLAHAVPNTEPESAKDTSATSAQRVTR